MLFLAGGAHGYYVERQKWTRRYLPNNAVSLKRVTLTHPPKSIFQKKKTAA